MDLESYTQAREMLEQLIEALGGPAAPTRVASSPACSECDGSGSIAVPEDISQEYHRVECASCHGTGKVASEPAAHDDAEITDPELATKAAARKEAK